MNQYWQFLKNHWALLGFGFLSVFWGNFGQSFFIGWYGEAIKTSLGISAQTYGAVYSAATLASAATVMWLGGVIDRWPLRRFCLLVCGGLFLACVLLTQAINIIWLAIGWYCIRLFGQALLPHTGITTMARHFDQHRGKAISIAGSGVSLGEVVLPTLAVWLIGTWGWRTSWGIIAVSIPVLLVPAMLWLLHRAQWRDQHMVLGSQRASLGAGRSLLFRDRRFWCAMPTLISVPFVLTAIFIHQDFILEQKQWSARWIAQCFVIYGVAHWISSMLFGVLVDRFSGVCLLRVYSLPMLAALLLTANGQGSAWAVVMMGLLGITIGASGPVVGALWAEVYGDRVIGAVRASAGAVMVFSTAVSPVLVGWLIDQQVSLQVQFNLWGLLFSGLWLLLRFSYRD